MVGLGPFIVVAPPPGHALQVLQVTSTQQQLQ